VSTKINTNNSACDLAFELMSAHLPDALAELFAAYDLPVCASPPSGRIVTLEREVVARIGFAGKNLSGALLLKASETSIARWLETLGMGGGDLTDTLSEFSNMLLGRIKSRMLREGLCIQMATPITTVGSGLRLSVPPNQSALVAFDGKDWSITVRLAASFDSAFELGPTATEEAAEAGECILF
jgi:CheY-specific phosphatase CheX